MIRIQNTVDKSVTCIPTLPIALVANTQQAIDKPTLPTVRGTREEYAGRYIQNNDAATNVYYAFGHQCDTTNYNGIIGPLQQFDASNCADAVYCYSTANVTVSTTVLVRKDLSQWPRKFENTP